MVQLYFGLTLHQMKVYTDTSVIGGYYDKEFQEWSVALFNEFLQGINHIMFSELTHKNLSLREKK